MKRAAALAALAVSLTGCNGSAHGTATVWITRDRGTHVVLVRNVPAGLTAMQGLERVAHVQSAYAGRFVQAIDGIAGSLSKQHDWFYFINGYEADRGAAEYRLHPGDVEWWDYRSWKHAIHVPIVVGAFPEPFLHGYDGRKLRTVVVASRGLAASARAVAALVHGDTLISTGVRVQSGDNVIFLERGSPSVQIEGGSRPGSAVTFVVRAPNDPVAVLRAARFHYALP